MAYARVRLGLPLGGINKEDPARVAAPTQPFEWNVQDLQGLRYVTRRSIAPWPSTATVALVPTVDTDPTGAVVNVSDTSRVTRIHNIHWGDGSADIVRHTRRAMCELSAGTWVQRTEPLAFGASGDGDYWGAAVVPDAVDKKGRYLFSNRIVGPFVWTGTGNATAAPASSLPCRIIVPFADRANLFNVLDGGIVKGRTALWSIAGNGLVFTGTGSGNRDFLELESEITGAAAIRRNLYVYSAHSIAVGVETFDPDAPVAYSPVVTNGIGCWAPGSLLTYNDIHAFLSEEGFKVFDGSQIQHIGLPIDSHILDRINRDAVNTICGCVKPDWHLAMWALPLDGASTPSEIWSYDFLRNAWHRLAFQTSHINELTAMAVVTQGASLAWNDASMAVPWTDATIAGRRWIDMGGAASQPTLYYGRNTGQVRYLDESATSFPLRFYLESQDLTFEATPVIEPGLRADPTETIEPDDLITLEQLEIVYRTISGSATLYIHVSTDGGQNWTSFTPSTGVVLTTKTGNQIGRVRVHGRITGSQLRVFVSNWNRSTGASANANVYLEDFIMTVRKAGKIRAIA